MALIKIEMDLIKSDLEQAEGRKEEANLYRIEGIQALNALKNSGARSHYIDIKLQYLTEKFDQE